jgi:ferredoxin
MRVTIDPARCQGHAQCALAAPDVFELGDDGYASVLRPDVPSDRQEAARHAAAICPEQAVSLTD